MWKALKWLLLLGVPLLLLSMFTFQNLDRTTGLSLNLGVFAFELEHAWPVPCLVLTSFFAGWFSGELSARIRAWNKGRIRAHVKLDGGISAGDDDWV